MSESRLWQFLDVFGNTCRAGKSSPVLQQDLPRHVCAVNLEEENNCDEFVPSEEESATSRPEPHDERTLANGIFNTVSTFVSDTVKKIINVATPFLSLLENIEEKQKKGEKVTVGQVNDMFENIEQAVNSDPKISSKTKAAIHRIVELTNDENLRNIDITDLLARCKNEENTQLWLELARRIRSGEDITVNDSTSRRTLSDGL